MTEHAPVQVPERASKVIFTEPVPLVSVLRLTWSPVPEETVHPSKVTVEGFVCARLKEFPETVPVYVKLPPLSTAVKFIPFWVTANESERETPIWKVGLPCRNGQLLLVICPEKAQIPATFVPSDGVVGLLLSLLQETSVIAIRANKRYKHVW
jgi:hypothetical protein